MLVNNIKPGTPDIINVLIEISAGGAPIKYEIDKDSGTLVVDRFMGTPMYYPANYGFIPGTLSDDGDPCDVLVITPAPIAPGALIKARPVGVLKMTDESGQDEKIIAVPVDKLTPLYKDVQSYTDLPASLCDQIKHFFEHYKDLEAGKWVKIDGFGDKENAKQLIQEAVDRVK
jgi:inorganic pyrophosphatase